MINLTDAQVERIKFLFYTPKTELPTEKLVEQLNTELKISLPEGAYALLFQAILEKKIIERPRKVRPVEKEEVVKAEKVTEFTFAVAGKTVVVDTKEKSFVVNENEDQGYEPFVVSPDEVVEESTNEQDVDVTENTDEVETFSAQTAFNPFN